MNLWGKLFLSLELPTFEEIFKVTSVPFFIPDYNLLSGKMNNFMLFYVIKYYIELFYIDII